MALNLVSWQQSQADGVMTTGASKTMDVLVAAGDLLVCTAQTANGLIDLGTCSGGGLTWDLLEDSTAGSTQATAGKLWAATATATTTVTVEVTASNTTYGWIFGVWVWRGHAGYGESVKGNSGATDTNPSLSLVTTAADSAICATVGDWGGSGFREWDTIGSQDASPESRTPLYDGNNTLFQNAHWMGLGAAGSKTVAMTDGVQRWNMVAVEIKAGSSTASTVAPTFVTSTATAWNVDAEPKSASSVAVQAGDLLVVSVAGPNANGAELTFAYVTDDGNLVGPWTNTAFYNLDGAGSWPNVRIWYAHVTGTGNVVVTVSNVTGTDRWGFVVSVWRGHGGVGQSSEAHLGSGSPTTPLVVSENSGIVAIAADSQAVTGTQTWAQINSTDATSDGGVVGDGLYWAASAVHWVNAGTAGSKTVNQTAPATGQTWMLVAAEILGAPVTYSPFTVRGVVNL